MITEPGDMLIFVSGHFPILGMQMLYFADPELARRSAIPPPVTTSARCRSGNPNQLDKPEFVTDDTCTTGLERGFIEELGKGTEGDHNHVSVYPSVGRDWIP